MLRCNALLMLGIVLGLPCLGMANDWLAFDHDAQRSGISTEQLKFPLQKMWEHRAAQRPRPAWSEPGRTANMFDFDIAMQPVIAGDLAYFGSSADDTLYALDTKTGIVSWSYTTGGPIRFAPQIVAERCYLASDDGYIYCLNARTGELIWKFHAAREQRQIVGNGRMISRWPCRSGVLVHEGTVYCTAGMWPAEGIYYYALDAASGEQKWCNDTLNAMYLSYPHDGVSFGGPTPQGYLLTDGTELIVPTGQSAPAALDAKTGKFLYWQQQKPGSTWARLGNGFVMVSARGWQPDQDVRLGEAPIFRGDGVAFYERGTGEVTADAKWRAYDNLPQSVRQGLERWRGQIAPIGGRDRTLLDGDQLYASGMGVVEAIACGDKLERRWSVTHPHVYCLIKAGNHLLVGTDGAVSAMNIQDGTIAWRGNVDGQARGLAVANGKLFVSTEKGIIHAFSTERNAATAAVNANPIAKQTTTQGFALYVGDSSTEEVLKYLQKAPYNVICLLDSTSVQVARQKLLAQDYGQRIVVQAKPTDGWLPFADYFANEIVIDGSLKGIDAAELYRVLHPCTGRLTFTSPQAAVIADFAKQAGIPASEIVATGIARGPLPGAFDWNVKNNVDERIKWPLELLWFGGPGRERTMARHRKGLPPPIPAHGSTIVSGDGYVTVVDAYNGIELWSRRIPKYQHIAADDRFVYISLGAKQFQCDAQTGRLVKIYGSVKPMVFVLAHPQEFETKPPQKYAGKLGVTKTAAGIELHFATVTPTPDDKDCWTLWFDFRKPADRLFPTGHGHFPVIVNTKSGTLRKFDGFVGAAVPELKLERRDQKLVLAISNDEIRRLVGEVPADFDLSAELSLYEGFDVRHFSRPLTDGKDPWQNGTATFVLSGDMDTTEADLLAGVERAEINAVPLVAKDWGRTPLSVRHDGNVPRAPLASEASPDFAKRINPLTGDSEALNYLRGYGCSGTICSSTMDFFRSGTLGFYDLADDSGMRNFAGVRPGCRITILPAQGVLFSSEGVGDCFCPYNFSTTLALAPTQKRRNEDWALYVDKVRVTQLQKIALNLGAPGDRRDDEGQLWIGYPRQPMMLATGGSIGPKPHANGLPATFELYEGGHPLRVNSDHTELIGSTTPWMHASGIVGIKKLSLGLIFHEPKSTVLGISTATPPKIDAELGDAAWSGDAGIGIATESKSTSDKGRCRVRYDDQNLYLAYEQQPVIDRKGNQLPWNDAFFDVLLKDQSKTAYAHFGVTSRGTKNSRLVNGVLAVPSATSITIDGLSDDWAKQGLELELGEGRGNVRLVWKKESLVALIKIASKASEKPGPGLRLQFANKDAGSVVEIVADVSKQSAKLVELLKKNETSNPDQDVVDEPDPTRSELLALRDTQPLPVPLVVKANEQEMVLECEIPLSRLNLTGKAGAALSFQVSAYDPKLADKNITDGGGARRALLRGASSLTLALTDKQSDNKAVAPIAQKREWFGTTVIYPAVEVPLSVDTWQSSTVADKKSYRTEFSIPWSILESAGLARDRLLAQFRTQAKPTATLEQLQQSFATRSVRIHTEHVPVKEQPYRVRLHFAELEEHGPGDRVFDIKLQGQTVAANVDIFRETGGVRRILTKEFRVNPGREVELEFPAKTGLPLLNGIEIIGAVAE